MNVPSKYIPPAHALPSKSAVKKLYTAPEPFTPGEPEPKSKLPTTWHVLPQESDNLHASLARFEFDGFILKDLMDAYLRGVVFEAMKRHNAEAIIKSSLDRRIEVAVKQVADRMEREMAEIGRAHAAQRIRAAVDALQISVSITVGREKETTDGG